MKHYEYIEETLPIVDCPLWWHEKNLSYTSTGYGDKIPSRNKVLYNGKLYRVYVRIYSNVGTAYIVSKGVRLILRQY